MTTLHEIARETEQISISDIERIKLEMGICLIPLTQGKFATVDANDFDLIGKHKWYYGARGYAVRQKRLAPGVEKLVYMHREILGLPGGRAIMVDHIDGDRTNNRRSNLRLATNAQNQHNKRKYAKNATAPYKGVYWHKQSQRWRAAISFFSKRRTLGNYKTAEDAARAYDKAARIFHGEYAFLNFPDERVLRELILPGALPAKSEAGGAHSHPLPSVSQLLEVGGEA